MNEKGDFRKTMNVMMIFMAIALLIALSWDHIGVIRNVVHSILDPSAGVLLEWNLTVGMLIIVFIISMFTMGIQKYATDQKTLKELKAQQKEMQKEMKKYRDNPQKMMEINRESMGLMGKIMGITLRGSMFTIIPMILLYRWFGDYFANVSGEFFGKFAPNSISLLPAWVWFYLIFAIFFSSILRKVFKIA